MKIELNVANTSPIKAKDMPLGSVAISADNSVQRYVIRTEDNGNKYIVIWPNSTPHLGIEARNADYVDDWDVVLQPKGTSLTFKF